MKTTTTNSTSVPAISARNSDKEAQIQSNYYKAFYKPRSLESKTECAINRITLTMWLIASCGFIFGGIHIAFERTHEGLSLILSTAFFVVIFFLIKWGIRVILKVSRTIAKR